MAKSTIGLWLKDRNNIYKQFPVNPETISRESPFDFTTVKIASLGDIIIPGERGLKKYSFSSFFPRDYNASYCEYEDFMEPWKWVEQIEKWRDTRLNLRLIITGTPISVPVFVESFDLEPEKAGAPGDIYYSITLVEHRPFTAKELITDSKGKTTATPVKQPQTAAEKKPTTITVAKGDTLWKIAKAKYGDGAKWSKIYEANKATIGKNPDVIKPGQKLVIPT